MRLRKLLAVATSSLALILATEPIHAQTPAPGVRQSGTITPNNCVKWVANRLIGDVGATCNSGAGSPGGSSGQVQYNNAGAFGGFTLSGDCTLVTSTGVVTCTKSNGTAFGTAAFQNTGTSGANIPFLNGANTYSGASSFTALQTFNNSDIAMLGSSTGKTTFTSANAGASNFTLTFPAVTDTFAVLGTAQTFTAVQSFNSGDVSLKGATSGALTLNCTATCGANTATLPANTGTVAELNLAQTWSALQGFNSGDLGVNGATSGQLIINCAATCGSSTATFPANTGTVAELNLNQTFTGSITMSGAAFTPATTNGIVGTTLADNANAGSVGEYISSTVLVGSAIALTSTVAANVTSISLTAGDWECNGDVWFHPTSGAVFLFMQDALNTTSATIPTSPNGGGKNNMPIGFTSGGSDYALLMSPFRVNVNTTTTLFLIANANFNTQPVSAYGFVGCIRAR